MLNVGTVKKFFELFFLRERHISNRGGRVRFKPSFLRAFSVHVAGAPSNRSVCPDSARIGGHDTYRRLTAYF